MYSGNMKPVHGSQINFGHPSASGLIGCWLFNEGGGTQVADLSEHRNHGILSGTSPSWSPGNYGPSVLLPGTDEHILITDTNGNLDFEGANESFTVIVWINPYALSTYQSLVWIQDENDDMWRVLIWNDGTIKASLNAIDFGSTSTVSTGIWQQVAVVFDKSGNGQIYIDGQPSGTPVTLGGEVLSLTTNEIYVGYTETGTFPYNGQTNHLMIWDKALSAGEIAQLYADPFCMFSRDPIELWIGAMAAAAAVPLTGSIAAVSAVTGSLEVAKEITGSIAAVSAVTGSLEVAKEITGSIAAVSAVTGSLEVAVPLSGGIVASSAVVGEIQVAAALVGEIQAISSVTADIIVDIALTGSVLAMSALTGILYAPAAVSGLPEEWAWIEELIDEEGRALTTALPGVESDADKPWRGNVAGTPTPATGVFVRYKAREFGDHVKRGDQKVLLIPNTSVDIEEGTKIVDSLDNSSWNVIEVEKITNKSDILLYILQVRK